MSGTAAQLTVAWMRLHRCLQWILQRHAVASLVSVCCNYLLLLWEAAPEIMVLCF